MLGILMPFSPVIRPRCDLLAPALPGVEKEPICAMMALPEVLAVGISRFKKFWLPVVAPRTDMGWSRFWMLGKNALRPRLAKF